MTDTHTFIVNTDNALDTAYYGMYFYQGIHDESISFYEEPAVSEEMFRAVAEKVHKQMSRNSFGINDYRIVFLISRNCAEHTENYLCNLYVSELLSRQFTTSQLNKIDICFINKYEESPNFSIEKLRSKFNRINTQMNLQGYLDSEEDALSTGVFPSRNMLINKDLSSIPENVNASGIRAVLEECINESAPEEGEQSTDMIKAYSDRFRSVKDRVERIRVFNVTLNSLSPESQVQEQLYLCRFLLDKDKSARDGDLGKLYDQFRKDAEKSGMLAEEAARLAAYADRVTAEKARLSGKLLERNQKIATEYNYKEPLPDIDRTDEIGGSRDVLAIIHELNRESRSPEWEQEYMQLLDKLGSYEKKLADYGKDLSEEIHRNIVPVSEPTQQFADLDSANEVIGKQLEAAMENYYELRKPAQDQLSTMLDITNQFHKIMAAMKRRRAYRESSRWTRFISVLFAGILAVLIPYSLSQTYIYSAILKGNLVPVFSLLIFVVSFLLSKGIVAAAMNFRFRKEMLKFEMLIKKYMDDIKIRQKHYHDTVNAMIQINNVMALRDAVSREVIRQDRERNLLNYHKHKLEEREKAMKYFGSFIRNKSGTAGKPALSGSDTPLEIDPEKSVLNNQFYWI